MENEAKISSSLQKDINRLRKTCTELSESNRLRKLQIKQFDLFIKKLLSEDRITTEEISMFMDKKKNISFSVYYPDFTFININII